MFCCNYRSLGTLYTIEFNCSTTSELGEQMLLACFVYPLPLKKHFIECQCI